jgi:voltage-gated potassium channel
VIVEFQSYLNVFWLVIITVCTVGYGDLFACTVAGRAITLLLAMCASFVMAILVGIITSKFKLENNQLLTALH